LALFWNCAVVTMPFPPALGVILVRHSPLLACRRHIAQRLRQFQHVQPLFRQFDLCCL
jgi:hypothetical protein